MTGYLSILSDKYGAGVLISAGSYKAPGVFKLDPYSIKLRGYNLFTGQPGMSKHGYACANKTAAVMNYPAASSGASIAIFIIAQGAGN